VTPDNRAFEEYKKWPDDDSAILFVWCTDTCGSNISLLLFGGSMKELGGSGEQVQRALGTQVHELENYVIQVLVTRWKTNIV